MKRSILILMFLVSFIMSSCRATVVYEKKETNILYFSTEGFSKYNDITLEYDEKIEINIDETFISYYLIKEINKDNTISSDQVFYYVLDQTGELLTKFNHSLSIQFVKDLDYTNINANKSDYKCYLTQKESQIIIESNTNVEISFDNKNRTTNYFIVKYIPKINVHS